MVLMSVEWLLIMYSNKKENKENAISNKKKDVVCRRYSKANPDLVKKIRIVIFKPNPATKRDIVN